MEEPLQANCPQLADNFIEDLYVADIQRIVAQSKNRPQTADDFKFLFLIPWDHHRRIIDKCKGNMDKALFFVRKTWENNWGRDVLLNWLDTDLYERDGKAITNFQATLPAVQSDLAQQITKDPSMPTSMPMWYIRKFTECKPQWFSTSCIRERTCWLL